MAKFDLWYKKILNNNEYVLFPLASYSTKNGNTIPDGSFEESLVKSSHSFATLSFKIAKYSYLTGIKKINSLVEKINQGAQIRLKENSGNIIDFIITKISYEIHSSNIILEVSCQDLFSYTMTKRNSGYKLDALDDYDFIGTLAFDKWVERICDDCKITRSTKWEYKKLIEEISSFENSDWNKKINYSSFDSLKSFSVSDSNGYNALTSLGDLYGLNLITVYANEPFFFFVPNKNPEWSGFSYHPQLDLQELSISSSYENFATILNVTSQTDKDGNEISIIPVIPSRILNYFGTEEWKESHYYPGYYDFLIAKLAGIRYDDENQKWENLFTEIEFLFKKFADVVPFLENKLIDYEYFSNINLLSQEDADFIQKRIYDDLRIVNGQKIYYNNAFLVKLAERNSFYSKLQSLTQKFHAALDVYVSENGKISDMAKDSFIISTLNELETFIQKNSRWNNYSATINQTYININELLSSLMNDYIKYEQKFLQSLYELYQYIQNNNITNFEILEADKMADIQNFWNQLQYYGEYTDYYVPDFDTNTAKILLNSIIGKKPPVEYNKEKKINKVAWTAESTTSGASIKIDGNIPTGDYWGSLNESLMWLGDYEWKGTSTLEQVVFYKWTEDSRKQWAYSSFTDLGSGKPLAGLYKTYILTLVYCNNETTISSNLKKYTEESQRIWIELYDKYPSIFLEADFKDDTATSPEILLESAQNYFKSLKSPAVEYDISTIDIRSVYRERKEDKNGATTFIENSSTLTPKITDQIKISASDIEDRPGELHEILNKALFVNEIEQDLRSDIIKLKVNPLTYTDILLKNLAKLVM